MKYAIETHNLVKIYDNDFKAVDNLNLFIEENTIGGILGPNGAGKTTTMKMLATLIKPTSGNIFYNGKSIFDDPDNIRKELDEQLELFLSQRQEKLAMHSWRPQFRWVFTT